MALNPVGFLHATIKQFEAEQSQKDWLAESTQIQGPLTFGPFGNNLTQTYAFDKGAWDISLIDKMNSDIVVIFLSKMAQLYRKTNTPTLTLPIHRGIKDMLIKDKFPHHISKEW